MIRQRDLLVDTIASSRTLARRATLNQHYNVNVPSHVPQHLIHDFDIYDYEPDPFWAVRRLTEERVPEIFWTRHNGGHWVPRTARAITAVMRDSGLFSSTKMFLPDERNPEKPFIPAQVDPPLHTSYRKIISPFFAPARVRMLEDQARSISDELIGAILEKGECEFMSDFASIMPLELFLSLVDLPVEDRGRLRAIAERLNNPNNAREDAMAEFTDYLLPKIEDRFANPADDVISSIISQKIDGRSLDVDEMLSLVMAVLAGGLDTVAGQLGFLVHHIAENPEDRQRLIDQPDVHRSAVEEILRRYSIAQTARVVTRDAEFRDVNLRNGDRIGWTMSMYNLDESVFPQPMEVDFDRKTAQRSFGDGVHFCPGAFLARMELRVFIGRWLSQVGEFRVKPGETIEYSPSSILSYKNLPLIVSPRPT